MRHQRAAPGGGPTGTYTVTLIVRVENTGDLQLADSQATLNLETVFNDADSYTFVSVTPAVCRRCRQRHLRHSRQLTLLPANPPLHGRCQARPTPAARVPSTRWW